MGVRVHEAFEHFIEHVQREMDEGGSLVNMHATQQLTDDRIEHSDAPSVRTVQRQRGWHGESAEHVAGRHGSIGVAAACGGAPHCVLLADRVGGGQENGEGLQLAACVSDWRER
jgi:hypothetical protein